MENLLPETASTDCGFHELELTRSVLLAHPLAGQVAPGDVILRARRYSSVTHWEELLCAVIYPKMSKLMAVVSVRMPDGYSGILCRQGSVEYVSFFIDWGDGKGFQATGLAHFTVCDAAEDTDPEQYPMYYLVSADFDADRYWDAVIRDMQPRVRAVLSWNHEPEMDIAFTPVFGNYIDSKICIYSLKDLMSLFGNPKIVARNQGLDHTTPAPRRVN